MKFLSSPTLLVCASSSARSAHRPQQRLHLKHQWRPSSLCEESIQVLQKLGAMRKATLTCCHATHVLPIPASKYPPTRTTRQSSCVRQPSRSAARSGLGGRGSILGVVTTVKSNRQATSSPSLAGATQGEGRLPKEGWRTSKPRPAPERVTGEATDNRPRSLDQGGRFPSECSGALIFSLFSSSRRFDARSTSPGSADAYFPPFAS